MNKQKFLKKCFEHKEIDEKNLANIEVKKVDIFSGGTKLDIEVYAVFMKEGVEYHAKNGAFLYYLPINAYKHLSCINEKYQFEYQQIQTLFDKLSDSTWNLLPDDLFAKLCDYGFDYKIMSAIKMKCHAMNDDVDSGLYYGNGKKIEIEKILKNLEKQISIKYKKGLKMLAEGKREGAEL